MPKCDCANPSNAKKSEESWICTNRREKKVLKQAAQNRELEIVKDIQRCRKSGVYEHLTQEELRDLMSFKHETLVPDSRSMGHTPSLPFVTDYGESWMFTLKPHALVYQVNHQLMWDCGAREALQLFNTEVSKEEQLYFGSAWRLLVEAIHGIMEPNSCQTSEILHNILPYILPCYWIPDPVLIKDANSKRKSVNH